ncbi:hypothetical protein [Streptomyces sp. G45]|uniref:hypothetical protein n=1 Tax=Streptomyces sp. G45 TaxID=3406627 RepID=UPI003C265E49
MGGVVRYVIEVYRSHDGVCGNVSSETCGDARPFHGWLELLSLLEPPLQEAARHEGPAPQAPGQAPG